MTIQYYIKNVYGKELIYVLDPEVAGDIRVLTGKKTIDIMDINALERLGCVVERVVTPTNLQV